MVVVGRPVQQVAGAHVGGERISAVVGVVDLGGDGLVPRPARPEPHAFAAAETEHERGESVLVHADRAVLVGAVEQGGDGARQGEPDDVPQAGEEGPLARPHGGVEGVEAVDHESVPTSVEASRQAAVVRVEGAVLGGGQQIVRDVPLDALDHELHMGRHTPVQVRGPAAVHGGTKHLLGRERGGGQGTEEHGRPVPVPLHEGAPGELRLHRHRPAHAVSSCPSTSTVHGAQRVQLLQQRQDRCLTVRSGYGAQLPDGGEVALAQPVQDALAQIAAQVEGMTVDGPQPCPAVGEGHADHGGARPQAVVRRETGGGPRVRGRFQCGGADPSCPYGTERLVEVWRRGCLAQQLRCLPQLGHVRWRWDFAGRERQVRNGALAPLLVHPSDHDLLDPRVQQPGVAGHQEAQRQGPGPEVHAVRSVCREVQQVAGSGGEGGPGLRIPRGGGHGAVQYPGQRGVPRSMGGTVVLRHPLTEDEFRADRQDRVACPLPQGGDQRTYLCPQGVVEQERLLHHEQPASALHPMVEPLAVALGGGVLRAGQQVSRCPDPAAVDEEADVRQSPEPGPGAERPCGLDHRRVGTVGVDGSLAGRRGDDPGLPLPVTGGEKSPRGLAQPLCGW